MRHFFIIVILCCTSGLIWAQGVVQAEYFWNSDPGPGNGTAMTAADGNFGNAIQSVLANTSAFPSTDVHTFHVRIQDENGGWSPVFSTVIEVEDLLANARQISVTAGEYFWNSDPGQGSGSALVAFDGNFDSAIETILGEGMNIPAEGANVLNIRVRDAKNNWSAAFGVVIDVLSDITTVRNIEITAAEYFWDTDPGQGNGTPMLAFDGSFDQAIQTVINENVNIPSEGVHVMYIRARDAENAWSTPFGVVIQVEPSVTSTRDVKITAAEYYFDTDPGAGNGTPMVALDGNFNSALEAIVGGAIPSPIEEGIHVLWMRARDAANNWGPPFGIVVNMDTTITGFEALINGPAAFCQGDNLIGINYSAQAATGSTYSWAVTNGVIVGGQGTPNVTVNWNPGGTRTLELTQCLGAQCETASITLTIHPIYNLTDELTICEGQSAFLGGAEQTLPGDYTDVYESVNGCDSVVVTTLNVVDQIVNNTEAAICEGESIFLGGAQQTQPGSYTDTYESAAGCDSLVVTELTVNPTYYIDDVVVNICPGDSAFLSGDYQTIPGFYTDLFETEFGCDSVVVSELIAVSDPMPAIEQVGNALQTGMYVSYQWYLDGEPIPGADGITWEPTQNGMYTVEVSDENGCSGISDPYPVVSVGVEETVISALSVYPNPTAGFVTLQLPEVSGVDVKIQVLDVTGRVVQSESIWFENRAELDLSGRATGTYLIRVMAGEDQFLTRIVKM